MTDKDILYLGDARGVYGCRDGHGYYFCRDHGNGKKSLEHKDFPFAVENIHPDFKSLDSGFCTKKTTKPFKAKVTRLDGFTVLAFWDYSGDDRPGANSTFVMRGFHRFPEMIVTLQEAVPDLFKRFGQTVEMYELEERTGGS